MFQAEDRKYGKALRQEGAGNSQRNNPTDWRAEGQKGIQTRQSVNIFYEQIMDEWTHEWTGAWFHNHPAFQPCIHKDTQRKPTSSFLRLSPSLPFYNSSLTKEKKWEENKTPESSSPGFSNWDPKLPEWPSLQYEGKVRPALMRGSLCIVFFNPYTSPLR